MVTQGEKLNFYLIVAILILSFTKGALAVLGLSETITQLMIEGLIVLLFFRSILAIIHKKGEIQGTGLTIQLLLLSSIFISFLLTQVNTIQYVLFLRNFLIYYLFFYALFNLPLTTQHRNGIKKLILVLFGLQILFALIKWITIGTEENYIGSISISEGSIATIMPLFAISYLLARYFVEEKMSYILWIILFIGVSLMSNKMGILFYVIFLYFYLAYIHANFSVTFLKKTLLGIFYLSLLFMAFVSLNPRANPEHRVGGSVDIAYLFDYLEKYQTLKSREAQGIQGDGRFDAPAIVVDRLAQKGTLTLLFGFGPGELIKSSFTPYENPLRDKYHIGYGGRLGSLWLLMQLGFVGLLLGMGFHLRLYQKVKHYYQHRIINQEHKILLITFMGLSAIYFIDMLSYSPSLIFNPALILTYLYTFFYISTYQGDTSHVQ